MQITCTKCGINHTPTAANLKRRKYQCRVCRNATDRNRLQQKRNAFIVPKDFFRVPSDETERRHKVRGITRLAVQRGEIAKQPCQACGAKAEIHHIDYDTPWNFIWLCRKHHREEHFRVWREAYQQQAS